MYVATANIRIHKDHPYQDITNYMKQEATHGPFAGAARLLQVSDMLEDGFWKKEFDNLFNPEKASGWAMSFLSSGAPELLILNSDRYLWKEDEKSVMVYRGQSRLKAIPTTDLESIVFAVQRTGITMVRIYIGHLYEVAHFLPKIGHKLQWLTKKP